jgi:hypothetical protein
MRPLWESMKHRQTVLGVLILANAVVFGPICGYGSQVAVAFSSVPSPVHTATATVQVSGVAKIDGDPSTRTAVPQTAKSAPQSQRVVNLAWKASTSAGVKYNIYRSTRKGECLKTKSDDCKKINPVPVPDTNYVDNTVQIGQSYFYVAKAVRSGGTESGPSNETQAVISPPKP